MSIAVKILVDRPPITENELRKLLNFAISEVAREGLYVPEVFAIIVISKEDFERSKEQGGIVNANFIYREVPVDTLIIRGDIHTNVFVMDFLKAIYVIALYRTALVVDMKKGEEWAREHFIKALSYMVS
ncbi:MAG: hypothetical protein J7J99_00215 [Thermoprotei archaeon]|nr:hypothetical protein [Thermoprotei archaeon]